MNKLIYPCPFLRALDDYRLEVGKPRSAWAEALDIGVMATRRMTSPSFARVARVQLLYPVITVVRDQAYRTVADAALDVPFADPHISGQAVRVAMILAGAKMVAISDDVWPEWEALLPTEFGKDDAARRGLLDLSEVKMLGDAITFAPAQREDN